MPVKLEEFTAYRYQIGTDPNTGDAVYRTFDDKPAAIRSIKRHLSTSAKKEQEFEQWLAQRMQQDGIPQVPTRPKVTPEEYHMEEETSEGEDEGIEIVRSPAKKQAARR
jgi:hypothetical protein